MSDPLIQTLTVTGDGVYRGDVIAVGGIPHRVRDVREVYPRRRRLEFEDGNAYVLGAGVTIEVTRTYVSTHRRLLPAGTRTPRQAATGRHTNVTAHQ